MLIKINGHHKLMLFKKRAGLEFEDFKNYWKVTLHKNTFTSWMRRNRKPNAFFRKHIHMLTMKTSPKGKYRLVISPIDWISTSTIHVFTGEFLMLWRINNNLTMRDFAKMIGYSITNISFVENGEHPTKNFQDKIFEISEGLITHEMWEEDLKRDNDFW